MRKRAKTLVPISFWQHSEQAPGVTGESAVKLTSSRQESGWSFEVRTSATPLTIATIRTVAADLAARADFDLDAVDDLRMAVDEVCTTLVRLSAEQMPLNCRFAVWGDRIELVAAIGAEAPAKLPPTESFSWRLLESLLDDVSIRFLPGAGDRRGQICFYLGKNAGQREGGESINSLPATATPGHQCP